MAYRVLLVLALGASLGGCAAGDMVASGVTGQYCSSVRMGQGRSYCRGTPPPPAPQPYCTRTLGYIQCWSNPEVLPGPPHQVADGPRVLTQAQEANRTRRWPGW